ncbi:hypothetical protein V2J09_008507 [Rumex salicifolius]
MASTLLSCSKAIASSSSSSSSSSSIFAPAKLRRRIPIIGAICVLSVGFSSFLPSLSSSYKTGPKISNKEQPRSIHTTPRMEATSNTAPSIVVYCTVPNKEAGKKLAESIVKTRLAACVNRVPGVESVYEWKGEIQTDAEELLIIKTRESLLGELTEHIKANHEYDVPEVISLPITGGNLQYLEWLKNSTKD